MNLKISVNSRWKLEINIILKIGSVSFIIKFIWVDFRWFQFYFENADTKCRLILFIFNDYNMLFLSITLFIQ